MPETQDPVLRSHPETFKIPQEIITEVCIDQGTLGPERISVTDRWEKLNHTAVFIYRGPFLSAARFVIRHGEYVKPTRLQNSPDFTECEGEVLNVFQNILVHDEIERL